MDLETLFALLVTAGLFAFVVHLLTRPSMFKIAVKPTFTTRVNVQIANDKAGHDKVSFIAHFDRIPQTEVDELLAQLHGPLPEGTERPNDQTVIDRVFVGWDEVVGEDGEPLEFTPHNVQAVCDISPTRPRIVAAFFAAYNGEGPVKNSKR